VRSPGAKENWILSFIRYQVSRLFLVESSYAFDVVFIDTYVQIGVTETVCGRRFSSVFRRVIVARVRVLL
jgi:hypothetical protein